MTLDVHARPLAVRPDSGNLTVIVHTWTPLVREWTTMPGTANRATFTLGHLSPDEPWHLSVDGHPSEPLTPDANGDIVIETEVAYPRRFAMRRGAALPQ